MTVGKLLKDLQKELDIEVDRFEKEVRGVLLNGVGVAQDATTRVQTGFLKNNWFFSRAKDQAEIDRPASGSPPNKSGLTATNLHKWSFGENAFIVNNTSYASYHDLGTIYIYPLFISFQVETYIEKAIARIK